MEEQDTPRSNLAVVRGSLRAGPTRRELPSGRVVVQFDVATRVRDGDRVAVASVPVAWHDPTPSAVAAVRPDDDVLVVGTVRRRFFRSDGATQSRTELVAERVVPTRRAKTVRAALAQLAAALSPADG